MGKSRQISFLIGASARGLYKTLDKASRKFKRWGRKTERIGRNLSTNFTAPLALAGTASVKLASDFESSMLKINTLIGVPIKKVNEMKSSVIELSNVTGRSSKELADALFVINSAGIKGSESLKILEQSAKASAIGLGETKQIAKATTAILQAYGTENITAAEATDTLLQTVKAGNLEASELAPSLGRVIGIASQLGVSFKEVRANVATFTRLGVSSEEAITGLRSVMNALLKPTAQGKQALDSIGMSFKELRTQVREKGLAETLSGLMRAFNGNTDQIAKLFPNVRALSNILGTAGAQGEAYREILEGMGGDTNQLNESFAKVSKTTQHKFNRALQKLKNLGIQIGTKLFPIVNKLLAKVEEWVDWFTNLSDSTQNLILKISGIVGAVGPALIIIGKLSTGIGALIGFFGKLSGAVAKAMIYLPKLKKALIAVGNAAKANPYILVGAAIAALGYKAYQSYTQVKQLNNEIAQLLSQDINSKSWKQLEKHAENIRAKIATIQKRSKKSTSGFGGAGQLENLKKLRAELEKTEQRIDKIRPKIFKTSGQILDSLGLGLNQLTNNEPLIFKTKVETEQEVLDPIETGGGGAADSFYGSDNPISRNKNLIVPNISAPLEEYQNDLSKMRATTKMSVQKISQFGKDLASNIAPTITNGLKDIGTSFLEMSIKSAIAGNAFSGVFKALLSSLADLAIRVGKIAIATGVAIEGIKKALQSLNPAAAIGAGVALIALGAGAKAALSNAAKSSSGSSITDGAPTPSGGPSLSNTDAQRVMLSSISNQSQFDIQQAFERALNKATLKASGSDLQLVLNNSNYNNR